MALGRKTGYAVVGLGNIALNSILPAFANCKKAELAAVVSRDNRKAAAAQRKFKAAISYNTKDYADCLTNPEISAVYIATPPGEHEQFAVRAAEAGKHVLCEKPLAATVAQSTRMVEACQQRGVLLMTAYRKYFEPSALHLKSLVRTGALGRIDMIHTSFSELFTPGVSPDWLLDQALAGGGPMMDLGVYCVNTTRWLVDEDPVEAEARAWRHDARRYKDVEEGVTFRLSFPSGVIVQGSSTYSAAMSSFIFVQGTKGWVSLSPAYPFEDERRVTGKIAGRRVNRRFRALDEFALEIDAFASAIQKKNAVDPDGMQGHRDMIILEAIYESVRIQQPVAIKYPAKELSHGF
ncbi:MAG: Gfo/Idh/MocA family oxidoreductase [Candidatus Acidiferrum sp.]